MLDILWCVSFLVRRGGVFRMYANETILPDQKLLIPKNKFVVIDIFICGKHWVLIETHIKEFF
jgi:hypothetical protein